MVVSVDMGIDGLHETGRFSTFYTVNVVHAFTSGMGAGFLLSCFVGRVPPLLVLTFCSALFLVLSSLLLTLIVL